MSTRASTLFSSWPSAGNVALVTQHRALLSHRLTECPIERTTTFYCQQSAAGNTTGGGGTGMMNDPFLVRHAADYEAMMAVYGAAGNCAFLMHDQSVLRGNTGLTFPAANVTLGTWGTSSGRWVLSGFTVDSGSGWTDTGAGMYTKTVTSNVYWVRLDQHPSIAYEAGTETIFRRNGGPITGISIDAAAPTITTGTVDGSGNLTGGIYHGLEVGDTVVIAGSNSTPSIDGAYTVASTPDLVSFTVAATTTGAGTQGAYCLRENNCWAYDPVSDTLLVRIGANVSPASTILELCQASGKGIYATGKDGCRLDSAIVFGWGMESIASQNYCVHSNATDTESFVVSNTTTGYSGHHQIGHLRTLSGTGGMFTAYNCKFGLCTVDSVSQATLLVGYSTDGDHEWVDWFCTALYGALPDITRGSTPVTVYARTRPKAGRARYVHANASNELALAVSYHLRSSAHTWGCASNSGIGNMPAYTTNRGHTDEYRAWVVHEVFEDSADTYFYFDSLWTVHISCNYQCTLPADWASANPFFPTGVAPRSTFILCTFAADYTQTTEAGALYRWTADTSGDMYVDFIFCSFFHYGRALASVSFDPRAVGSGNRSATTRWFNCIWSVDTSQFSTAPCCSTNGTPEGATSDADASVTGGMRSCAFYDPNVTVAKSDSAGYQGYDNTPGFVDLSGEPALSSSPQVVSSQTYQAANTANLPYAVGWYFDANNTLRTMPALPSIGSAQAEDQNLTTIIAQATGVIDELLDDDED